MWHSGLKYAANVFANIHGLTRLIHYHQKASYGIHLAVWSTYAPLIYPIRLANRFVRGNGHITEDSQRCDVALKGFVVLTI